MGGRSLAGWRRPQILALIAGWALFGATWSGAQEIKASRGVDPRVDYASLVVYGPWDDRNYQLKAEDLAWLAPNEAEQKEGIPAFFRVELRKTWPDLRREGPAQYPRSALQRFWLRYGGYLIDGRLYRATERRQGRWWVDTRELAPTENEYWSQKINDQLTLGQNLQSLDGNVRITSPNSAAESAIAISPADQNLVIAGTNGPVHGQDMHYSSDGGATWSLGALPSPTLHCCDPTVVWSSDGSKAFAATLGDQIGFPVVIFRSADHGQTWSDLANEPGGNATRELGSNTDKEYLHLDVAPTSPFQDNLYLTWHENNTMFVSRSTDAGHTWATPLVIASLNDELGIGSDITSDRAGNVYYFWPAFNGQKIFVRKSTNGGSTYSPRVQIATTQASFTFPVPSMESREVFVYCAADADLSNGPFSNSLYVAWTDSTAATGGTPANNHARIQVARSRDGGATWQVTTPHETADAATVDRYHPWLRVGPDGRIHVIFYDSRLDPTRAAVDIYYAVSNDGAVTWSTPRRLTTVSSPNIANGFEFGDYNGLDVVANQLTAIFTDNRAESGGGDSVDVYGAGFDPSGLFADGFELGTTAAWSAVSP